MEETAFKTLLENCDVLGDGYIERCDLEYCLIAEENERRATECPWYHFLGDECRCERPDICEVWNCDDIKKRAYTMFNELNINGDYAINSEDLVEEEHWADLSYCDLE